MGGTLILAPSVADFYLARERFKDSEEVSEIVMVGDGPICLEYVFGRRNAFRKFSEIVLFGVCYGTMKAGTEVYVTESMWFGRKEDYPSRRLERPSLDGTPLNGVPCYTSTGGMIGTAPGVYDAELAFLLTAIPRLRAWRIVR